MIATAPAPRATNILGRRLLATFVAVLLLTLAGSAIGVWSLRSVDAATRQAIENNVATERLVADAYRLQSCQIAMKNIAAAAFSAGARG